MSTPHDQRLHDLFGTLNGVGLQLEVMALAFTRGDATLHANALEHARTAVATLATQLAALRSSDPDPA